MTTMNVLGMSDEARRQWAEQAGKDLAAGDDRLAKTLAISAARQFAALVMHHADQILATLCKHGDPNSLVLPEASSGDSLDDQIDLLE